MKNKIAFSELRNDGHFKVSIFGSSRIKKNDSIYKKVRKLARMLEAKGMDVITGGGPGLMEAANEGHRSGSNKNKGKNHSIGIGIKLPWEQKFNKSLQYQEEFTRFSKRLDTFMLLSNAVIVAPGGLGTILELFYTLQLAQVQHICNIPIILMGEEWKGLLKWIKNNPLEKKYLDEKDYKLLFHVKDPEQAIKLIEDSYINFKKGGKKFCLNYKKYKV